MIVFVKFLLGGGLCMFVMFGCIDVDVMYGFFCEFVRRRYDVVVIDVGVSRTFERFLYVKFVVFVDDDFDDLI